MLKDDGAPVDGFDRENAMHRIASARVVTISMVAAMVLLTAMPVAAEEKVTVEVRSITASVEGEEFDEELDDIKSRLHRGFEDYSSFRQLDRQTRQIERDDKTEFKLPSDDLLTLGYDGRTDDFVRLGLVLEDRLSTTLRASPGSTFFQAGLRYDDGLLIVAITVE